MATLPRSDFANARKRAARDLILVLMVSPSLEAFSARNRENAVAYPGAGKAGLNKKPRTINTSERSVKIARNVAGLLRRASLPPSQTPCARFSFNRYARE